MGIVARIALTSARGHDRLSAAAGGGDRPRRDAAWRQRGRCRGDVRIRAGRHRSTDVWPRRVRRDARAQSGFRRSAHRVLRDGRVTRPRGPMGIDVHPRSRRPLRIRPRRPGQRRRLPGGGGAGHRRWSSRGAHQVRFDLVGGGDRTGDPAGSTWLPCPGFVHGYWTTDYGPDVVPNAQRIQATPAAKAIYTHDGRLYAIGEGMVQADLARTLERLATGGPDAFYRGEIAEEIAADFQANDGFITREDLASYRVTVTEPIRGTYRDLHVAAAGPPAGRVTLRQMLNFLEGFSAGEHGWPRSEAARLLVEAMAWAVADRDLHIADPRFVEIPTG